MIHQLSSLYGSNSIEESQGPAQKIWLFKRYVYNSEISKKYNLGKTMDIFNEKSLRRVPHIIIENIKDTIK